MRFKEENHDRDVNRQREDFEIRINEYEDILNRKVNENKTLTQTINDVK
jgi:hypothetical protein